MIGNYLLLSFVGTLACLVASTIGRESIVGGVVAESNEFPYQVSITIYGYGHGCGGGIIGELYILTAASCVVNAHGRLGGKPITVIAGVNDFSQINDQAVIRDVVKVFVPGEYSPRSSNTIADIAVLKLSESFHLTRNHRSLMQLKVQRDRRQLYTNQVTAQIAGFGWTWAKIDNNRQVGGRNDTKLYFANADVLSPEECMDIHPSISINLNHVCARVKQFDHTKIRGVCVGDGGSPLVYQGTVIGIFSLGPAGCAENGTSGIYTRVSQFRYFIRFAKEDHPMSNMLTYIVN